MPYIGNVAVDFNVDTHNITNSAVTAVKLSPSVGSNGQVLSVDANGNLQWSADASGTSLSGSTNNTITTVTGANAIQGEANLTFDGTTLKVAGGSNTTQAVFSGTGGSGARGLEIVTESVGAADEGVIFNARASGTTGRLTFKTNSATAMTILGNGGNVGIGTTSPDQILHLATTGTCKFRLEDKRTSIADGSQYGVIQFEHQDSSGAGVAAEFGALMTDTSDGSTALQFITGNPSSKGERLRITSTGTIGVGIATPVLKMHLHEASSGNNYLKFTNTTTGSAETDGTHIGLGSDEAFNINQRESNDIRLFTGATERLRITGDGPHLLLGGTADVNEITESASNTGLVIGDTSLGNGGIAIINSTTGAGRIYFGDATGSDAARNRGQINYYHNGDYMMFATAGSERLRIDSSGNITAVNTTSGGQSVTLKIGASNASGTNDGIIKIVNGGTGNGVIQWDYEGNANRAQIYVYRSTQDLIFTTAGSERCRIDSSGNVGIATSSPTALVHIDGSHYVPTSSGKATTGIHLEGHGGNAGERGGAISFACGNEGSAAIAAHQITADTDQVALAFFTHNSSTGSDDAVERMRIGHSVASVYTGITDNEVSVASSSSSQVGATLNGGGSASYHIFASNATPILYLSRRTNDGILVNFYQDTSNEGNISVSGSTVSYNGGHLSRWSQLDGISATDKSTRPTIYMGTVMSNLDKMCEWKHEETLYEDGDTIPTGKSVGDVKEAAHTEENQQLNMTKVSDTVGDKDVAGVFWTWDDEDDEYVNDFYIAMTGDMIIRVAGSTTVARGDLLESAGDGTAKPQSDDIVRSKTIAKITSTNFTATYPDGSKAYPCVLMAC